MNWSKIICALISFLGTGALTYAGVPVLAVVFVMAMVVTFLDVFIKKGEPKIDFSLMGIAIILCIILGHYNWGW